MERRTVIVDGVESDISRYWQLHERRFRHSIDALRKYGAGDVLEVGGHPWAMTSLIAQTGGFRLAATVSAEEMTYWPDDIGVTKSRHRLEIPGGWSGEFTNYAVNIERTLTDLESPVDAVFACEVIEHLIRAPHIMLLNINRWLKINGKVLLTTPNGMQFNNPLRRKNSRPAYRCHCYERHNGLFTLDHLTDMVARSGFRILESGYWSVYDRNGLRLGYELASRLPLRYFREKFTPTIYVIAEKTEHRSTLTGCPSAYANSRDWEYIDLP